MFFFFFQAEDGIRDLIVTGVQTCALPISAPAGSTSCGGVNLLFEMARKLPRLQRVLDAPALASVAYGEIASSIYFALGIVALHALGFTPLVLGLVGLLFLLVSLSYAEGTASIRETGGAATFVRIAFNDLAGFLTGWALFLDYLIVIALSALFMPHYLGLALGIHSIARHPGDVISACVIVALIAVARLLRRS